MNPLAEKISDAEAEIMQVLWKAGRPLSFAAIRTALQTKDKARESNTINTLVNRLVKKGALRQEKRDVFYYTPLVGEAEYTEYKTRSFLSKVYGGSARDLLSALVNYRELTQADVDELREYLKQGGEEDA